MTETEIRKLREAILQLWEGSKNIIVLREGITLYTQKLK